MIFVWIFCTPYLHMEECHPMVVPKFDRHLPKLCLKSWTILSGKPSACGFSLEAILWVISCWVKRVWNSSWDSVPWSVDTTPGTPYVLRIFSKNARATLADAFEGNAVNSTHLANFSMHTETSSFPRLVVGKGPEKSIPHPTPPKKFVKNVKYTISTWSVDYGPHQGRVNLTKPPVGLLYRFAHNTMCGSEVSSSDLLDMHVYSFYTWTKSWWYKIHSIANLQL